MRALGLCTLALGAISARAVPLPDGEARPGDDCSAAFPERARASTRGRLQPPGAWGAAPARPSAAGPGADPLAPEVGSLVEHLLLCPAELMTSGRLPRSRLFTAWATLITRVPWLVLALLSVVTGLFAAAASTISVNNANDIFFVETDPLLVAHKRFQQRFGSDEFVMVYVEGELFSRPAYDAVRALVEEMSALRYNNEAVFAGIISPFHAPTVRDAGGSIAIEPLLTEQDDPSAEHLARARADATNHPVYRDLIVNREGNAGAVVATLRTTDDDNAYQMYVAEEMGRIVDTAGLKNLGALLVGNPIFKKETDKATMEEAGLFGSAAIVVSIFALFLLFRRKRQVTAAIGVVVIAVVWTVGLKALLGFEMSLVSIILPLVIVIMGLGSGVHVINEFREQRFAGALRREAVIGALGVTGVPCLLTAMTTAVGFLAMLTAPVQPMRSLGLFAALGVLIACSLALTLVPAVLAIGKDDAESPEAMSGAEKMEARTNAFFGRLGDLVVGRAPLITLAFLALSGLAAAGLPRIVVESHVIQAFRKDQSFRQAVEHVDQKLGGSTSVELVIDSGVPGGVYDADFLRRVAALQRWILESQGDVVGTVLSVTDLLREINFALTGKRALPDSRARAAQLMLLYESGDGDTRMVLDHSARRARMTIRTLQSTTTRSLALEKDLRKRAEALFADWHQPEEAPREASPQRAPFGDEDDLIVIDNHEGEVLLLDEDDDGSPAKAAVAAAEPAARQGLLEEADPPLAPGQSRIELAGTSQLFVHLAEYVIKSQINSFALATVVIAFLMMLMLRSVKLGIAVMVPNILPIVSTYGIMGWIGVNVDWLTALVGVAALGVAVDGTIHIGTRYRLNMKIGMSAKEAAHAVLTSIGRAIVVTSAVLSAGFLVVTPSILASLARFGVLMALCLFLALLFDLLMTPAVLAWLSPKVRR
jgi:uncharacterized protein